MEFKIDYIVDSIQSLLSLYAIDSEQKNFDIEQKKKLQSTISNLHSSDQSIIFTKLKDIERQIFVKEFINYLHEDILLFLEKHDLYEFFQIIGLEKFLYFLALLEFDEMIEILENFNEETQTSIIKSLPFKKKIQIKRALSYPEFSCGRNMSINFLSVPYWWTVARTKKYIKDSKKAIENEEGNIFVTNEEKKVIGTISIIKILNEEQTQLIVNIFDKKIITVKAYDSIPEIANLFDQYDIDAIPVVNRTENIIGVLEISEVVEYLKESSDSHVLKSVGIFDSTNRTIFGMAFPRFLWLMINFLTAICASCFISFFEKSIAKVTTLAVLMPIVSTMGGNCGAQTATVIIRSIFTSSITKKQIITEISIALLNGICLAVICFFGVWFFYSNLILGAIFGFSIMLTLMLSGLCGVFIPIFLKKIKIDPPIGTSIMLTTITDCCGFATILFLGTIFLIK